MKLLKTSISFTSLLVHLLLLFINLNFCKADSFCRCENEKNLSYLIFEIDQSWKNYFIDTLSDNNDKNDDPSDDYFSNDCSYCTKINCQLAFHKNDNKATSLHDLKVNCFQRESLRDKAIIYGFFFLVFCLLVIPLFKRFY